MCSVQHDAVLDNFLFEYRSSFQHGTSRFLDHLSVWNPILPVCFVAFELFSQKVLLWLSTIFVVALSTERPLSAPTLSDFDTLYGRSTALTLPLPPRESYPLKPGFEPTEHRSKSISNAGR